MKARDAYIVSDPENLGGTPVIKETRITVYSVLPRIEAGESLEEISADYAAMPYDAFEAAAIFAKANPTQGHPKCPWRNAA